MRWVARSWPRRAVRTRSRSRGSTVKAAYSLRCGNLFRCSSVSPPATGVSRSQWPSWDRAPSSTAMVPSGSYTSCSLPAFAALILQATVFRSIHCASALVGSRSGALPVVGSRKPGVPDSFHTSRPWVAKSSDWSAFSSLVSPLWMM